MRRALTDESAEVPLYDAFLSYATSGDYLIARRIEAFLEGFHQRIAHGGPSLKPLRICRDGSDFRQWLPSALRDEDAIWHRIEASLRMSSRLVVACSPESAASAWVDREVDWMIRERGAEAVLLVITKGEDPAADPSGFIPPAAIRAGLQRSQIWYDLREWRGVRGTRVRNAEDELVRLALDLLEMPQDAHGDVAALWQREDLRRKRRVLQGVAAAALAVLVGAALAAWQFVEAQTRAEEARAASLVRVAESLIDRSPLMAALVFSEVDPRHAPPDALQVGARLTDQVLPRARLRGARHGIVVAALTPDGQAITVDAAGGVLRTSADGNGTATAIASPTQRRVVDAALDPPGKSVTLAFQDGEVRRLGPSNAPASDAACRVVVDDVRHLTAAAGADTVLVTGYKPQAYWCGLGLPGERPATVLPLDARVMAAWRDETDPGNWRLVTDAGTFWQVEIATGRAVQVPSPGPSAELVKAGTVDQAAGGRGGRFAVAAGDILFIGVWNQQGPTLRRIALQAPVKTMRFGPDGTRLAVATKDGIVHVLDGAQAAETVRVRSARSVLPPGPFKPPTGPSETRIARGHRARVVTRWTASGHVTARRRDQGMEHERRRTSGAARAQRPRGR